MIHHQIIIILYDYNVDDDVAGVPVPVPTLTLHPLHLSILPQGGNSNKSISKEKAHFQD